MRGNKDDAGIVAAQADAYPQDGTGRPWCRQCGGMYSCHADCPARAGRLPVSRGNLA